jgi:hypothetical protein
MVRTDVILTPDQRVRVFISSTQELAAEQVAAPAGGPAAAPGAGVV